MPHQQILIPANSARPTGFGGRHNPVAMPPVLPPGVTLFDSFQLKAAKFLKFDIYLRR